jgi:ribosome recycling factor
MDEEVQFIIDSTKEGMDNALIHLTKKFINIRAGKAMPSMVSGVMVDYYGTPTPISQVANVSTPEGIHLANIGFNPMNNGESVIINVPPLTEERRVELVKQAKAEAEESKVGVRNDRKHANNEIKKADLSEDLTKNLEMDIQKMTDNHIIKIDAVFSLKEKEIMTV